MNSIQAVRRPILTLKKPTTQERAKNHLSTFPAIRENLPLAVGIHRKLFEHAPDNISKTALRKALFRHTRRKSYRRAVAAEGSQRHWLDGTPIGPVDDDHRRQAAEALGVKV